MASDLWWLGGPVGYAMGQASDYMGDAFKNPGQDSALNTLQQGSKYKFVGANPYQGGWDSLIGQLRNQANGVGPSLAGNAYNQASQNSMAQQVAMSRGASAGAARSAGQNLANIGQGQAAGYANARLQEQMGAQQQLGGALQGAGQAWLQPQLANQNMYAQTQAALLGQPSEAEQFAQMFGQIAGGTASMMGKH